LAQTRLGPEENTLDTLNRLERSLGEASSERPESLKASLVWGLQALELLFNLRIHPHRGVFDDWFQDYLKGWVRDSEPDWGMMPSGKQLSLIQILDLLSEQGLPSLQPEFYQGWRDKAARCNEIRSKVGAIIQHSLSASQRHKLLHLVLVQRHLSSSPHSVTLDGERTTRALLDLLALLEALVDSTWPQGGVMQSILARAGDRVV